MQHDIDGALPSRGVMGDKGAVYRVCRTFFGENWKTIGICLAVKAKKKTVLAGTGYDIGNDGASSSSILTEVTRIPFRVRDNSVYVYYLLICHKTSCST